MNFRHKFRQLHNKRIFVLQIRGAVTVVSLLGITWVLGPFSIGWGRLPLHYIFCLTTPLQGMIIFVVRVLQHNEAKNLWINFLKTGSLRQRPKTPQSSFHTNSSINTHASTNSQTMLANSISPKSSLTSSLSSMISKKRASTASSTTGTAKTTQNNKNDNIRKRSFLSNGSFNSNTQSYSGSLGLMDKVLYTMRPNRQHFQENVPTISEAESMKNVEYSPDMQPLGRCHDYHRVGGNFDTLKTDFLINMEKTSLHRSKSDIGLNKSSRTSFANFIEQQQYIDNLLTVKQNKFGENTVGFPGQGSRQSLGLMSISPTVYLSDNSGDTHTSIQTDAQQRNSCESFIDRDFSHDSKNKSYRDNIYIDHVPKVDLFIPKFTKPHYFFHKTLLSQIGGKPKSVPNPVSSSPLPNDLLNKHKCSTNRYTSNLKYVGNVKPQINHDGHEVGLTNCTVVGLPRTPSEWQMWRLHVSNLTEYSQGEALLRRCISSDCLVKAGPVWGDTAPSYA